MRSVSRGLSRLPITVLAAFSWVTLLTLPGCDDEKKTAPTAPTSVSASATASAAVAAPDASALNATSPAASTPLAGATAAAGASGKKSLAESLKCETLLPEKARQAGLLNYKLSQQTTCAECGPTCSLVRPDRPFEGLSISYTCNAPYEKAAADKALDEAKKSFAKPVTLPVGKGAVMGEKDNGSFYSALAFDDDSNCKVAVDWMRGDKKGMEPVIKMALQNVKQADVDAAKK